MANATAFKKIKKRKAKPENERPISLTSVPGQIMKIYKGFQCTTNARNNLCTTAQYLLSKINYAYIVTQYIAFIEDIAKLLMKKILYTLFI